MVWCMNRYHLCCGPQLLRGWINVDRENFGQEIVADINKSWKWIAPGTAETILIQDGLEHLDSLQHFLEQSEKALAPGGVLEIRVPHYKNPSAYRFTHRHFFSYSMFRIYPEPHDSVKNLHAEKIELVVDNRFPFSLLNILANLFPNVWERAFYVSGIRVRMRKDQ